MKDQTSQFSKNGLLLGALLIAIEYFLFMFFYAKADPELWNYGVPHKYIFYITFVPGTIVLIIVLLRQELKAEVIDRAKNVPDFKMNVGRVFGFAIFGLGSYIVYYVLKGQIFKELAIYKFVESNMDVNSAADPFAFVNAVFYSILSTFVYQGFLLNGVSKHIGYQKATMLTSLFYGYWYQDIIGATAFNLFMNHIFYETTNIAYPAVLSILISVAFLLGYLIKPDIWFLKADYPDYNEELFKGFLLSIGALPVVAPVLREVFKGNMAAAGESGHIE